MNAMDDQRSDKAPYHTPTLQLHGSIRDLTAADSSASNGDSLLAGWGSAPGAS